MSERQQANEKVVEAILAHDPAANGWLAVDEPDGVPSLDDGLAAQAAVLARRLASGDEQVGWKVGMTSGAARDKMGIGFRPFGHLLRSHAWRSGDTVPIAGVPNTGIEAEIGFRFDKNVRGIDVGPDDIRDAIGGAVACLEIQQQRLGPNGAHWLSVSDNLSQWGIVVGSEVVEWSQDVSDVEVGLYRDGTRVATAGPGFAIDDPIESLVALARQLARFGLEISAGQYVITGAFCKNPLIPGAEWCASLSGVGEVTARFV